MKLKHKGKEYSVEEFGELSQAEASQIVTEKLIALQEDVEGLTKISADLLKLIETLQGQTGAWSL